jgi:hypothetical protein
MKKGFIFTFSLVFLVLFIISCRTSVSVEIPVRTETVTRERVVQDFYVNILNNNHLFSN